MARIDIVLPDSVETSLRVAVAKEPDLNMSEVVTQAIILWLKWRKGKRTKGD